MKQILLTIILFTLSQNSFGQQLISGDYGNGLQLAFDSNSNKITGYFENYTGWDEITNNPKFSCVFYIEGYIEANNSTIQTYYPENKTETIEGVIEITNNKTIRIQLPREHGGCWNVLHFADEPVTFELEQQNSWIQIRYVTTEKTFFYSDKLDNTKRKSYLVKNDFVCINEIDGDWALCTYYGETTTKGWLKLDNLSGKQ